jgi:hypothetical protein
MVGNGHGEENCRLIGHCQALNGRTAGAERYQPVRLNSAPLVSTLSPLLEGNVSVLRRSTSNSGKYGRPVGEVKYTRISPTKSPVSRARNVSDHRLMSQVGRVREKPYVSATKIVEVPVFDCLRNSCNHVNEVEGK